MPGTLRDEGGLHAGAAVQIADNAAHVDSVAVGLALSDWLVVAAEYAVRVEHGRLFRKLRRDRPGRIGCPIRGT